MEGIINSIRNLFSTYGFKSAAIIIITVVIVNFIKKPIVKRAVSYAEKYGVDKSAVTKYVTCLPVAVSFVLELFVQLLCVKFNFFAVDYELIAAHSVMYGGLAIATYESVKKQLEAYAAEKNKTDSKADAEGKKDLEEKAEKKESEKADAQAEIKEAEEDEKTQDRQGQQTDESVFTVING